MANQYIQPDDVWPSARYGFTQAVVSTGTKIIHCAGQTAWDKDMNIVGGDDLEQQTALALAMPEFLIEITATAVVDA